jgi:predicted HAD superfamily phosphohydrolase
MHPVQLVTDCEGPLALNDNAFELCREVIGPDGERFFRHISRYDDFLGGTLHQPGHQNGDALKFILPFLLAQGLDQAALEEHCRRSVRLAPGAESCYRFLHSLKMPIYEISTSYRPFAQAVGVQLGFAPEHIVATEVDLSRYTLSAAEAARLRALEEEIVGAEELEIPAEATSLADLPPGTQRTLRRLDDIFLREIPAMEIGRLYREVVPVGGEEKAEALRRTLAETGLGMDNVMYVGDCITDVEAFKAVRAGRGVSLSFNGNPYAVQAAEFSVVADSVWPIALLAVIFRRWGKEGLTELANSARAGQSKIIALPEAVLEIIVTNLQGVTFNFYQTSGANRQKALQESQAMRARLRGEAVAALG